MPSFGSICNLMWFPQNSLPSITLPGGGSNREGGRGRRGRRKNKRKQGAAPSKQKLSQINSAPSKEDDEDAQQKVWEVLLRIPKHP